MKKRKEQRNMNKQSSSKKQNALLKYQVIIGVIMTILGVILGNSLYLNGYTAETMEAGVPFIYSSYGYTQTENSFAYTGVEGSYVQLLARSSDTEQLLFAFSEPAKEDTEITLYYVDNNGNYSYDNVAVGTWKKGKYTATVNLVPGDYNCYLLNINTDFTLSNLYYAHDNGKTSNLKYICYIMGFILGVVFAAVAGSVTKIRKALLSIDEKGKYFIDHCKKEQKTIGKYILKFVVIVAISILATFLFSLSGKFRLSGKVIFTSSMIGCLLAIYICFRKYAAKKIELIGCLTILIVGTVFSVVEPPNVGVSWDDEIHYQNTLSLSHLLDGQMSMADVSIQNDYQNVALNKYNYTREEQNRYNAIMNDLIQEKYYTESYSLVSMNIQIAYIPSAIGQTLSRGLGLSFYATIIAGRWMNVLLITLLAYFSMKKLKSGKLIVILLCLIPTNIFLSGNYTYDIWLTGWMMLGLSTFFGEWQKPDTKLEKKSFWIICISLFLAVMPKLVYFPLSLIALFMPKKKFDNTKEMWKYRIFIILVAFLPLVLVYFQNFFGGMGQGDTRGGEAVNSASQMDFIKQQPINAAMILLNFLKTYLNPYTEGREYLVNQAYLGYVGIDYRIVLLIIIVGCIISREQNEVKFPWWTKAGTLIVYCIIGFMAAFSMYVAFTAVGADTVAGCQGRYLIPAFFPVLYVCSRVSTKTYVKNFLKEENINIGLMVTLLAIAILGLWNGCLSLY